MVSLKNIFFQFYFGQLKNGQENYVQKKISQNRIGIKIFHYFSLSRILDILFIVEKLNRLL